MHPLPWYIACMDNNEKHTILKNGKFLQEAKSFELARRIVRMYETRIQGLKLASPGEFKTSSPFTIVKSKDAFGLFGPEGICPDAPENH